VNSFCFGQLQAHGRRLVTEIISNEIVGACREGPRGNDQYAAVFAAYVAGMSATSGIDFGANFVASLATSFEDIYQTGDSLGLRNLALLLSHLYNFHLLPSELLYQVLDVLCKRFEELDVAIILTILQSCGMGLRGDDPGAMKDFVLSVQQRTSDARAALLNKGDLSKRVNFMLETICEIKNNKRQTKEVPTHSRLKKWLQKIGVEDVQLRAVTWKSLLDPVKKGQWWLPSVGVTDARTDDNGDIAGAMDAEITEADKMLQLAASQRMNTDSRKAVFCMVMSGEDYIDAFEKLLRMKLPGTQVRSH
jgi:nucleolar MIF4G domain-containing protein 1